MLWLPPEYPASFSLPTSPEHPFFSGAMTSVSEESQLYKTEIPHLRYAPVRNDNSRFFDVLLSLA